MSVNLKYGISSDFRSSFKYLSSYYVRTETEKCLEKEISAQESSNIQENEETKSTSLSSKSKRKRGGSERSKIVNSFSNPLFC